MAAIFYAVFFQAFQKTCRTSKRCACSAKEVDLRPYFEYEIKSYEKYIILMLIARCGDKCRKSTVILR